MADLNADRGAETAYRKIAEADGSLPPWEMLSDEMRDLYAKMWFLGAEAGALAVDEKMRGAVA